MRRYLIICVLIAIVAISVPVRSASNVNINVGVTSETPQSALAGRINVNRPGDWAVFPWCSSTGFQAKWWSTMDSQVICDPVGFKNFKEVNLIVDDAHEYPAALSDIGWMVPFSRQPVYVRAGTDKHGNCLYKQISYQPLTPGSHTFKWHVKSKDKWNTFNFFIPLFHWNSSRVVEAANQVIIQIPPKGWDCMPPQEVYTWIRGFDTPWATQDPAEAAKLQMMPPAQPDNTGSGGARGGSYESRSYGSMNAGEKPSVTVEGSVRVESETRSSASATVATTTVTIVLRKGKETWTWNNKTVSADWFTSLLTITERKSSQCITMKRKDGSIVCNAEATAQCVKQSDGLVANIVVMNIYRGEFPDCPVDFWPEEDR